MRMKSDTPIRISQELRKALGKMKTHPSETYDMLLRRKLAVKRSRKQLLKASMFPNFMPGKATNKVLRSDKTVTKDFLEFP